MGFLLCFCGIAAILSNGASALLSIRYARPRAGCVSKPFVYAAFAGCSLPVRRCIYIDAESVSSTKLSKVRYGKFFSTPLPITKQPLRSPHGGFPEPVGGHRLPCDVAEAMYKTGLTRSPPERRDGWKGP
jgi:hypothetical protein